MKRREFMTGALVGAVGGSVAGWAGGRGATAAAREAWERDREFYEKERSRIPPEGARASYSQQGEDIVLFHTLVDLLKIKSPTYIDVGAAEPIKSNNTYLLYYTGMRGVLVEPNPAFAQKLRVKRPGDKVVEAGIGVTDATEADYYEIKGSPMLNTFSAEQAAFLQKERGAVVERVSKMPLININRLIQEQLGKTPDLLSTDIEGWDETIIKSLDLSRFRPGCICAEGVPMFAPDRPSGLAKYMLSQDYVVRGGSTVNTIYVDARRLKE